MGEDLEEWALLGAEQLRVLNQEAKALQPNPLKGKPTAVLNPEDGR